MSSAQFHQLRIASVRPQTEQGVSICFDIPEVLRDDFAFVPGQYLTLRATIDGKDVRRSYSICSPVDDALALEVGIKRVEGGTFSNYAARLKAGDELLVMPAEGRFTAPVGGQHHYLLIAAGSGITPCLSIASSVLAGEPQSTITLLYGNRNTRSVMFRAELEALKDQYTDRFILTHVLSAEPQDIEFLNGRIDGQRINTLARHQLIVPERYDGIYLCGPHAMIESCSSALEQLGVAQNRIRFELFTTDGVPAPVRSSRPAAPAAGSAVTIILDGTERQIHVDAQTETVLAAAREAGIDLPFSCAGGMCCTCRCKISSGRAEMDLNYSLQQWEIDAGFTLACQTRPSSDTLVLDFDAV